MDPALLELVVNTVMYCLLPASTRTGLLSDDGPKIKKNAARVYRRLSSGAR